MSTAAWSDTGWRLAAAACLVTVVFIAVRMDQTASMDPGNLDELDDVNASVSSGSTLRRTAYLALGAAGVLGLIVPGAAAFSLRGPLAVLGCCLIGWCSLSVLWSSDLAFGIRRISVFGSVLVAALAAVKHFSWRQILLVGLCASGVQLAASLAASLAGGTFRPWTADYRFSGLLHPNHEAVNCAVLFVCALGLAREAGRARLWLVLAAVVALGFLVLTRSRTSLVAVLAAITLCGWAAASLRTRLAGLSAAIAAVCLGMVVFGGWISENADRVVRMGRSEADTATLAGRVPLWQELFPYVGQRPLAGYGYNSFWTPLRIETLSESQQWAISHAHSDYLDVLLGAGLVGLTLYAAVLVAGILAATALARSGREPGVAGLPAWPWFAAIGGFTEGIGQQNGLFQFMLIAALAYAACDGRSGNSGTTLQRDFESPSPPAPLPRSAGEGSAESPSHPSSFSSNPQAPGPLQP